MVLCRFGHPNEPLEEQIRDEMRRKVQSDEGMKRTLISKIASTGTSEQGVVR